MPPPPADPDAAAPDLTRLKQLLWLYIALWIGEGALRKWIVPGLAAPLLVVRDPLLLFMYYLAFTKGLFPKGFLASGVIVLGATALMVSIAATSTPMVIQLYGLRASYLHLLLIFLIPNVFTLEDVRLMGKWTLIVAGPMALLVLAQFLAGPRSFLNAGAGGNVGAMIESAFGHIRPSGTFSFTNGLGGFTAMTAVFFLYHLLEKQVYPRLIWLASAPALVVLIVLSGSRSAAGLVALIMRRAALYQHRPSALPGGGDQAGVADGRGVPGGGIVRGHRAGAGGVRLPVRRRRQRPARGSSGGSSSRSRCPSRWPTSPRPSATAWAWGRTSRAACCSGTRRSCWRRARWRATSWRAGW